MILQLWMYHLESVTLVVTVRALYVSKNSSFRMEDIQSFHKRSKQFQKCILSESTMIWYTLFDRGTVKVCVVIYTALMYAPFVMQQMSILYSISCHTHSSMSAVTDAAASKMCCFNSSMSLGKGRKSLMCAHKKKSQGVRSGDLGSHFIKGESACPAQPIQKFDRCSFRFVSMALWKWGRVPHLAGRWSLLILL
jgi:hypothetical protein